MRDRASSESLATIAFSNNGSDEYPFSPGHYATSITYREGLMALPGRGNASICDNTLSKRSGNPRLKNREAGVVPSEARHAKLCSPVHTW